MDLPVLISSKWQRLRASLQARTGSMNLHFILITLVLVILPLSIVLYIGAKFISSNHYTGIYNLDFNQANFRNTKLPAYINENTASTKFNAFTTTGTTTIAHIAGTPIAFALRPKDFSLNKQISFSTTLKDDHDWEISLVCPECASYARYDWQPYYYGKLQNYSKVATYDGVNIFAKNTDLGKKPADTLTSWIQENVSASNTISILDSSIPKTTFANKNVGFIPGSSTIVDRTFRGSHDFYVYLDGALDLDIIKKDLNNYDGKDSVNISVYDLDDQLVHIDTLDDDGIDIKTNQVAPLVKKHIQIPLEKSGVYRLSLSDSDSALAYNDWTITYFKINTNKIVLSATAKALFLQPVNLYTEIRNKIDFYVNIWYAEQIQNTVFTLGQKKFSVRPTAADFNKPIAVPLEPGNYSIAFSGNERVYGSFLALNKTNYFDPFQNTFIDKDSDFIFTKLDYTKVANGFVEVSKRFTEDDLKRIQDAKTIDFEIRSAQVDQQFKQQNDLSEKGYEPKSAFDVYNLYGRKDIAPSSSTSPTDIKAWLKQSLLEGSTIENRTKLILTNSDVNSSTKSNIALTVNDGASTSSPDYIVTENTVQTDTQIAGVRIQIYDQTSQ